MGVKKAKKAVFNLTYEKKTMRKLKEEKCKLQDTKKDTVWA